MRLKENLKALIKAQGMTVKALGQMTGVPVQTIHNWLSGSPPRNLDHIKAVADFFGVTLDGLLFDGANRKDFPSDKSSKSNPILTYKDEIVAGHFEVVLRPIKKQQ